MEIVETRYLERLLNRFRVYPKTLKKIDQDHFNKFIIKHRNYLKNKTAFEYLSNGLRLSIKEVQKHLTRFVTL